MQESNPYSTPTETQPAPVGARRLRINKISPLTAGKITGALYAMLGVLIGAFMALFSLIGSLASGDMTGLAFGIGTLVFAPVFYGAIGLIGGLIGAVAYNFLAGMIGGIEMEVEV